MHRKTVLFSKSAITKLFVAMLVAIIAIAGLATGYYLVTQSPPPEPPLATPTPTLAATSEPTVTEQPSPTSTSTSTSGPTVTQAPTPTSTPTSIPAPTFEPAVTQAPTSTPTSTPTSGPMVTQAPTPTSSPPGVTQPPVRATPTPTPTTPPKFLLSVSSSPSAGGTVSQSPSAGSAGYASGTVVTLTAKPNRGYKFSYFTVDEAVSTNNPLQLTMNKQQTVVVYFIKPPNPVCSNTEGQDLDPVYNAFTRTYETYYEVTTTVTNTGGKGSVIVYAQMDRGSEPTLSQTDNLKASESKPFVFRFSLTGGMSINYTSVPHNPYCWAFAK